MNWIDIIEAVINFIEDELGNSNLSPESIAKQVHVSESHLSRAFHILTSFTLSEYIRNRRLSVAGEELKKSDVSILEVAHTIGYESPEAFSKAFKRFHGVNPRESRNAKLKEFYPLHIKLILTQERPLTWTIEEKAPFFLNGSTTIVPSDNSAATAYLWAQCETNGYLDQCCCFPNFETLVGVSIAEGYTIMAKCNSLSMETRFTCSQHKWAIFPCIGDFPQSILKTWAQIYTSWMPKTEYKIADFPQLEIYSESDQGYSCEIWIAVM